MGNVGYKSGSKHKDDSSSASANQQANTQSMNNYKKETQHQNNAANDDAKVNVENEKEAHQNLKDEQSKQAQFEAKVSYNDAAIDQQGATEVFIAPNSMGHIQMRLNDKHSLIYLTIYIEVYEGKWNEYCRNLGKDESKWIFEENEKNKPDLKILSDALWEKLAKSNDAEVLEDIDQSKVAANNKEEMLKWDEDDVCDYIKYLSRKYADVDAEIADKFEDEEIEGKDLWIITKKELKKKVGIEDKDARKMIIDELSQIREG